MNQAEAKSRADRIVEAARFSLNAGDWFWAYSTVGFAIEFALKACILARIARDGAIFTEPKFGAKLQTHDPKVLLDAAGLKDDLEAAGLANPALGESWDKVTDWKPEKRYDQVAEAKTRELFEAITDPTNGVLQWLKAYC